MLDSGKPTILQHPGKITTVKSFTAQAHEQNQQLQVSNLVITPACNTTFALVLSKLVPAPFC